MKTEDILSGVRDIFIQPIIKDRPNIKCWASGVSPFCLWLRNDPTTRRHTMCSLPISKQITQRQSETLSNSHRETMDTETQTSSFDAIIQLHDAVACHWSAVVISWRVINKRHLRYQIRYHGDGTKLWLFIALCPDRRDVSLTLWDVWCVIRGGAAGQVFGNERKREDRFFHAI